MSETAEPTPNTHSGDAKAVGLTPVHAQVPGLDPKKRRPKLKSANAGKDVNHLIEFYEDLRAVTTTTENESELVSRFLDAIATRARLFGSAWIEVDNRGTGQLVGTRFKNPSLDNPALKTQLIDAACSVLQSSGPQILETEKLRGTLIVCLPFFKDTHTTAVLCAVVQDDKHRCAEAVNVCQTVANNYDLWRSRDQLTAMAMEVRSTASVLELVGKTESCETQKDACVKIVNELQAFFRCDYVAIGLKKSNIATCKLMALSSMAEFDQESSSTSVIQSAFDEAILRGQYTSFPAAPDKQTSPALSHRKLAGHMRTQAAMTIPLRRQDETVVGAITIMGNRNLDGNSTTRNLITALEHPIGSCLDVVRVAEGGWFRKLKRMFVSKEQTNLKWAGLALGLISLIALFVPVPYRINANCTAEPVVRSFSVAPHDGLLENTLVEPGDIVKTGAVLANMDGRELGFQIANTVAAANEAATQHDSYLAHGEVAKSIEAELKRLGYEADLNVLENKQANLQIKSTIDGVVLSGSIDKRENYPVTLGQTLYEIAPISPLRVELAIPADEIMHVAANQKVKFRFDGFGTETITGVVERIRPSSTIRDDKNVFIAEAVLENEDGKVRPGMSGNARVYAPRRTLGWSLFHRPWEKIVTAIGF